MALTRDKYLDSFMRGFNATATSFTEDEKNKVQDIVSRILTMLSDDDIDFVNMLIMRGMSNLFKAQSDMIMSYKNDFGKTGCQ